MSKPYSPVTTPPKGRPTPKRPRTIEQRNRSATLGWVSVGIVVVAAIAVGAYVTSGSSGQPLHTPVHSGSPAPTMTTGPAS